MSRFTGLPLLELDFINAGGMIFDVKGTSIDAGRNGIGQGASIELSGGGQVVGGYANCFLSDAEHHEYLNWLSARLTGGFRFIDVPIMTDGMGSFPLLSGNYPKPFMKVRHSDGTPHSDGAPYSQATVWGEILENAPLNAGVIRIRTYGARRPIRWSDWFSIYHNEGERPKGNRAYRTWETQEVSEGTATVSGTTFTTYDHTVAISPPLRQAVTAGKLAEFARPRFAGRLPTGFSLPWEVSAPYLGTFSIEFVEAF